MAGDSHRAGWPLGGGHRGSERARHESRWDLAAVFLDSSALIRRYDAREPGAQRVRLVCDPASRHTLFISQLTAVEVASSFQRKQREGAFTEDDVRRNWRLFLLDRNEQYRLVGLTDAACARAEELVVAHPLIASDALQLACALAVTDRLSGRARLHFWTADAQQAWAARREGLAVEQLS